CPLPGHSERTPSFTVNEAGQFFKCFGCGRGGDVITFVMTMENLDYVGTVKLLAEQAGMNLPDDDRDGAEISKEKNKRDRLLALMKTAALFYVHNLYSADAEPHRAYITGRGIDRATVTAFGLGASTDFYSLPDHLRAKGFTDDEMIKCGVCAKSKKGSVYDSLHGRLIIPIINNLGSVIAFGGRLLEKKPDFAKYKNTQETELFVKNRTLYNINNLKKERAKGALKSIIMVEGYMDTISVYGGGFHNVVASMGTSLTVEQAKLLKRYSDLVYISYDGDGAGQKATLRGLDILTGEGIEVKVVDLPDGLDPDDVIKKRGADEYKRLLDEAMPLVDYKLYKLSKNYDLTDVSSKRKYIAEAVKIIAQSKSESEKEELLRKLGKTTGTTFEALRRDMDKSSSPPAVKENEPPRVAKKADDGLSGAARFVLSAMLFNKPYAKKAELFTLDYGDGVRNRLLAAIADGYYDGKEIFPSTLASLFKEEELEEYNAVLSAGDNVFGTFGEKRFFDDCVNILRQSGYEKALKTLSERFASETDVEKRKETAK
ncbi:MAG: DNA primase, partial [Clostridia bacterium]|nr:DNA primase [Clostridia bacterium]